MKGGVLMELGLVLSLLAINLNLGKIDKTLRETSHSQEPETLAMRVTAYCPCNICCKGSADGITANGHKIKPGERFVAADKSLPFGTRVRVPGYNGGRPVLVLDRGGAIKGNRLDVYFDLHSEAKAFGVRHLKVRIYAKQ